MLAELSDDERDLLAALGLTGLPSPTELGGGGAGARTSVLVLEGTNQIQRLVIARELLRGTR
ncbi:MAG: hypothetical protein WD638_03135 [Nitriliruptoraceae bacterium]